MIGLIIFIITFALIWAWFMICNQRTYSQRKALIMGRPHGLDYWPLAKEFNQITYDRHFWYLLTFRDPIKLYGPLTQAAWNKGH